MATVFHYTPVNAKQFDGLNIDGLAGKRQKRQNFPPSKINFALYSTIVLLFIISCQIMSTNDEAIQRPHWFDGKNYLHMYLHFLSLKVIAEIYRVILN